LLSCRRRMSKPTSIYFLMLAIFGAGLWLILSIGNVMLHAPTDLSGTWRLWAMDGPQEHQMVVQQSGRYLRLDLDHHSYDLKMTQDRQHNGYDTSESLPIELSGANGLQMIFDRPTSQAEYSIRLSGPVQGTYLGSRNLTSRSGPAATQPDDVNARP
jgi:hypothetical protein